MFKTTINIRCVIQIQYIYNYFIVFFFKYIFVLKIYSMLLCTIKIYIILEVYKKIFFHNKNKIEFIV